MSVKSSVGTFADWITRSYLVWVVVLLVALGVVLWIWHKPRIDSTYTAAKIYLGMQQPSPLDDWPDVVPTAPNWQAQTQLTPDAATDVAEAPPRLETKPKPFIRPWCNNEDWPQCEWSNN